MHPSVGLCYKVLFRIVDHAPAGCNSPALFFPSTRRCGPRPTGPIASWLGRLPHRHRRSREVTNGTGPAPAPRAPAWRMPSWRPRGRPGRSRRTRRWPLHQPPRVTPAPVRRAGRPTRSPGPRDKEEGERDPERGDYGREPSTLDSDREADRHLDPCEGKHHSGSERALEGEVGIQRPLPEHPREKTSREDDEGAQALRRHLPHCGWQPRRREGRRAGDGLRHTVSLTAARLPVAQQKTRQTQSPSVLTLSFFGSPSRARQTIPTSGSKGCLEAVRCGKACSVKFSCA